MAERTIRIWPDPALSAVAKPVDVVDEEIETLVADLFDTMYASNGIGLAANQVGVQRRVLVIDLDPKNQGKRDPEIRDELSSWGYTGPVALINPKIVSGHGEIIWDEGCLSVPGVTESVKRKEHIVVEALSSQGKPLKIEASGLFAVAIQHELDHLNGKVFVEYLSRLKRDVIKRKMLRIKAEEGSPEAAVAR